MRRVWLTMVMAVLCLSMESCGDLDLTEVTKPGTFVPTKGDGSVSFYRDPQILSPKPPNAINETDEVRVGFIVIYRAGATSVVPDSIEYTIRPTTDASLQTIAGTVAVTYVPAPPGFNIAVEFWGSFNPPSGTPLFTELAYEDGDYYYGVVVESVGTLPTGSNGYTVEIDGNDLAAPTDLAKTVKFNSSLTIPIAASLLAPASSN